MVIDQELHETQYNKGCYHQEDKKIFNHTHLVLNPEANLEVALVASWPRTEVLSKNIKYNYMQSFHKVISI